MSPWDVLAAGILGVSGMLYVLGQPHMIERGALRRIEQAAFWARWAGDARRGDAGRHENTPENMNQWIRHPHSIDDRTLMPEIGVGMQDGRGIAAYLYTLRSPPSRPR